MSDDSIIIPRKWQLAAHGQKVVFVWNPNERSAHVIMKALLWALYLPRYPDIRVETRIGDKYKPDVVALEWDKPLFWGESGRVGREKIESLVRRYPDTHLAIAKWETSLTPYKRLIENAITEAKKKKIERKAPFDLIRFSKQDYERFIDNTGNVALTHDELTWVRIE